MIISKKGHLIELRLNELAYSKETLLTKPIVINYKDIKVIFYEDKFKFSSEFMSFCDEMNKIVGK